MESEFDIKLTWVHCGTSLYSFRLFTTSLPRTYVCCSSVFLSSSSRRSSRKVKLWRKKEPKRMERKMVGRRGKVEKKLYGAHSWSLIRLLNRFHWSLCWKLRPLLASLDTYFCCFVYCRPSALMEYGFIFFLFRWNCQFWFYQSPLVIQKSLHVCRVKGC